MNEQLQVWKNITWLIQNDWGRFGTGFLIRREIDLGSNVGKSKGVRFFLISNKHVLSKNEQLRCEAEYITVYVSVSVENGDVVRRRVAIPLNDAKQEKIWREHPDSGVDVIAYDVTSLISQNTAIFHDAPTYDFFANNARIRQLDISVGDEVMVIGYPVTNERGTFDPIVTDGVLATDMNRSLLEYVGDPDSSIEFSRGFLVGHVTTPGSSGSPIVLRPSIGRVMNEKRHLTYKTPALLLGIIAQTRFADVKASVFEGKAFSGVGLAFSVETVRETIEQFFV